MVFHGDAPQWASPWPVKDAPAPSRQGTAGRIVLGVSPVILKDDSQAKIRYACVCFVFCSLACGWSGGYVYPLPKAAMNNIPSDMINHFAGIAPDSFLDSLRNERSEAKENAQAGFTALFAPVNTDQVSLAERFALAAFTLALHGAEDMAAFYRDGLAGTGAEQALLDAVAGAAEANMGSGPYGKYPAGPLSAEDEAGPEYSVDEAVADALGKRLAAAFAHAHMLVFHPRDASAAALQRLLDAGWSDEGVVTVSQLVTFLAYQVRLVHGLRVMARAGKGGAA